MELSFFGVLKKYLKTRGQIKALLEKFSQLEIQDVEAKEDGKKINVLDSLEKQIMWKSDRGPGAKYNSDITARGGIWVRFRVGSMQYPNKRISDTWEEVDRTEAKLKAWAVLPTRK